MAIIENDIQYNWVQKRIAKLNLRVDESTAYDSPSRIELELLSKLKNEYLEEHADNFCIEQEVITDSTSKTQLNIYDKLPSILNKVRLSALATASGKSSVWILQKLQRIVVGANQNEFVSSDLILINKALENLAKKIAKHLIIYTSNRKEVSTQIRALSKLIALSYICIKDLKMKKNWYADRMKVSSIYSFNEDDIKAINKATMQLVNELKSIELVL